MTDNIITPRIYVAVLADYNAGYHHGKWIDATIGSDAIWQEINKLFITSKEPNVTATVCNDCGHIKLYEHKTCEACESLNVEHVPAAEEHAIHDYEGFAPFDVSEWDSIDSIVAKAEVLATVEGEEGAHILSFLSSHYDGDVAEIESKIDDVQIYYGSKGDYAAELIEETGSADSVPDWLTGYIAYDQLGRDLELNGEIVELEHHVYVTNPQDF